MKRAHFDFDGIAVVYWKERFVNERESGIAARERKIVAALSIVESDEMQLINLMLARASES